jgi:hypothetical protein
MIAGTRMSADNFLKNVPARKSDLLDGRVVEQREASLGENMVRGDVFLALRDAVSAAGRMHNVYTFGALVSINGTTVRGPDCIVQVEGFGRARLVEQPVIVADVILTGLSKGDMSERRANYFSVPSIQHYLVIDRERLVIFHHERSGEQVITHIVRNGDITFADQGISIPSSKILGEVKS